MNIARAFWQKGDLERARLHYQKEWRLSPRNVDALLEMGRLLVQIGRVAEAGERLRRAIELAIAEAAANLEAARRMEANELTLLRYRVKQEFLQLGAAEQLLTLYAKAIVPQSTLALDSSVASYETGKVEFLELITNFTTVLDYELNYYQQLVNHEKALARLEELTGLDLLQ